MLRSFADDSVPQFDLQRWWRSRHSQTLNVVVIFPLFDLLQVPTYERLPLESRQVLLAAGSCFFVLPGVFDLSDAVGMPQ
jgi:hypothetical protein